MAEKLLASNYRKKFLWFLLRKKDKFCEEAKNYPCAVELLPHLLASYNISHSLQKWFLILKDSDRLLCIDLFD